MLYHFACILIIKKHVRIESWSHKSYICHFCEDCTSCDVSDSNITAGEHLCTFRRCILKASEVQTKDLNYRWLWLKDSREYPAIHVILGTAPCISNLFTTYKLVSRTRVANNKQTPWPESANKLYRLPIEGVVWSAQWIPTAIFTIF
jgi:hypothetical protein